MISNFKEKLNKISDRDIIKILFFISMFFCVLIGVLLVYNFDFTDNYNLLFDSDTSRVIGDMTTIDYNHYRLKVHPLFVILTEPVFFLFKGLTINKMLSLILISSIVTSLTVVFIYKLLSLYTKDTKVKVLISLSYLFTFSNYIYTAGIEIYNIAVLFLVIFWYYIFKKNEECNFNKYSYFIIMILGVLSMAFTITNGFIFLIILFILFIFKKIKFSKLLTIFIVSISVLVAGIYFQNIVWHNTPTLNSDSFNEESNYTDYQINIEKIKNIVRNDYYNSIISSDIYIRKINSETYQNDNYIISFSKINIINIIVISLFYIMLLVLLIRNFKQNIFANTGIILAIIFNSTLHLLYGNDSPFLYSLHFLYLFFISYGINLFSEKNMIIKKVGKIVLCILLVAELILNNYFFIKIIRLTKEVLVNNYFVSNLGIVKSALLAIIIISLIGLLVYITIKLIKRIKNTKDKDEKIVYSIILASIVLAISCVFVAIETTPIYNKFFIKQIGYSEEVISNNEKENLYNHYKNEVASLKEYEIEYTNFLKDYKNKKVDFLNCCNYFFLGLGNRRKLLYKDGKIIDIDKKETIYNFDIKSQEIIPNIYTIIIETKDQKYIKIYEDNRGVHIVNNNDDIIIENTDNYIELYSFDNQKYSNIKKVLYNEILFNIKNSIIYPNILVYDNPWYRDAALVSMVLKQTNNVDLITNWVNNIEEIYDKQNKGNLEADNLGELLYILSTQENLNNNLIDKIEQEAEKIANSNSKGYYIYGVTDFANRYLYQNLWYKLGIESVGRKYKYKLPKTSDYYDNTAWWINFKNNKKEKVITDVNFPYLSFSAYHKLKNGLIPLNEKMYPLSWEKNASEANYDNMNVLDEYYSKNKISPLHVWSASELLLLLLDDTNSIK